MSQAGAGSAEMMRCAACGAMNRVPRARVEQGHMPRCGRCKAPIFGEHLPELDGASFRRAEVESVLAGDGSASEMLGLYFGDGSQHIDHRSIQDHVGSRTGSDLLYKGALSDRSNAVFRGLIRVWPKAQRTDAYQTNRNLLLSRDAHATSLPNLEIEADDVRCSHAAAVGQLDGNRVRPVHHVMVRQHVTVGGECFVSPVHHYSVVFRDTRVHNEQHSMRKQSAIR